MRILLSAMLAVLLAGCVSTRTVGVPSAEASSWRGKSMALTERPRAGFVAMTAGKAAFALVGALAMIEAGKTIVEDNGIEDPAPHLARDLLGAAEQQYGVVASSGSAVKVDTSDVQQLARAASGADLLLDVQLTGYDFRYLPTQWGHYVVDSMYKVRLIEVHGARLVAEGFCRQTLTEKEARTKDELLADKAALLKSTLEQQRDACLGEMKRNVLSIQT